MTSKSNANILPTLQRALVILNRINSGHRQSVDDLHELIREENQPEVLCELIEAVSLQIVQSEAQEYRWRSKVEAINISPKQSFSNAIEMKDIAFEQNPMGGLTIDMRTAMFIPKLSVFLKNVMKEVQLKMKDLTTDLFIYYHLDPELVPELVELGCHNILIQARSQVMKELQITPDIIFQSISTIFHSFQIPHWGSALFKSTGSNEKPEKNRSAALLFPFHYFTKPGQNNYFCFVEYHKGEQQLRITIDDPLYPSINLQSIPHNVVSNLDARIHFENLKHIAKSVYYEILLAKQNAGRQLEYSYATKKHSEIFQELQKAGFQHLNTLMFYWSKKTEETLIAKEETDPLAQIGRILLALEEKSVIEQLITGKELEIIFGNDKIAYLDLSMRGQWLNISFDERRTAVSVKQYLERMPYLKTVSHQPEPAFENTHILLIHHLTPEILALMRGLELQGISSLQTLFVRYNPHVPSSYREALLSLPEENFHSVALQKCSQGNFASDYFILSEYFSSLRTWQSLKQILEEEKLDFFKAMQLCAGQFFFRKAALIEQTNSKLLLIEDGGYLAPFINRLCLENKTVLEALTYYRFPASEIQLFSTNIDLSQPLKDWLKKIFIGSIEHTRNGYDALVDVNKTFNQLAFPACSIAVSDIKRFKEGKEVAVSIIHAVESILHILGFVLSSRNVLVLGSCGTIGVPLVYDLRQRLSGHVLGVDVQIGDKKFIVRDQEMIFEAHSIDDIPKETLYGCDLFIGVIGRSILMPKTIEEILIHSKSPRLFFASGSTKQVEFTHLLDYLKKIQQMDEPLINDLPVILEEAEIRDVASNNYLGRCIRISVSESAQDTLCLQSKPSSYLNTPIQDKFVFWKEIYLLGDLMPINFYYSGVPTEIIDLVLSQLMEVSQGLSTHYYQNRPLPDKVLAVDHEIDSSANLL